MQIKQSVHEYQWAGFCFFVVVVTATKNIYFNNFFIVYFAFLDYLLSLKHWIPALQGHLCAFKMTLITYIIHMHMPSHNIVYMLHILFIF